MRRSHPSLPEFQSTPQSRWRLEWPILTVVNG
jgi:hypothetical protein